MDVFKNVSILSSLAIPTCIAVQYSVLYSTHSTLSCSTNWVWSVDRHIFRHSNHTHQYTHVSIIIYLSFSTPQATTDLSTLHASLPPPHTHTIKHNNPHKDITIQEDKGKISNHNHVTYVPRMGRKLRNSSS